jgi:hypothetical protein
MKHVALSKCPQDRAYMNELARHEMDDKDLELGFDDAPTLIDLQVPCREDEGESGKVEKAIEPHDDAPTKNYIPLPKAKPVVSTGARRRSRGCLSDLQLGYVFDSFYMARRLCGEPVLGLTYNKIRRKLLDLENRLFDVYGVSAHFDVVIRSGRAVILVRPAEAPP